MRVPLYDIKAQYAEQKAELDAAVLHVLESGQYSIGPESRAFEQECAELHGVRHGIAVNSGTDALRILMDAAEIGPGDEVITTAFTFVASVETIVQTGATPVFVDIDPSTFCIDPELVGRAVTPRTKAILPIHLFGQLADVDALGAIAERHGLRIVEDAAQAIATGRGDKMAGRYGIGAGFSFYVTKNLGAPGDGGLILTDDDEIAEACRSIRVHGMGRERYYYDHLGYTSRMNEMVAAVLRVKLRRLADWNARRQRLAAVYLEELAGAKVQLPSTITGNSHTWHQFTIIADDREGLMAHLKTNEVDSAIYYPVPIHYHEPYRRFGRGKGSLPVTERVSERCLSLPIHPHLTDDQVRFAAQTIRAFTG